MTTYRRDELDGDWEFKILRSMTGGFRRQDKLEGILEEEAQLGWVLVEKFDNRRIRLKRPASARIDRPAGAGTDPYRTYVGMSETQFATLIVMAVLIGTVLVVAIARLVTA